MSFDQPGIVGFMQGNDAMVEGAIAAGCRFFAGYPITPTNEVSERMSWRQPEVGGFFIQAEDELAAIAMVIGASWGGLKAMTATSGPGFSLMQEGISYACMSETPCVVADVQRCGPGQGIATKAQQGDVMQARWGAHGDHEIISLAPWSVQEMFELTIEAFNLSESFRVPCIILADEVVAHMRERVLIREKVESIHRRVAGKPERFPARYFESASSFEVPPMPSLGEGLRAPISGFSVNPYGYPTTVAAYHRRQVERICGKIRGNAEKIFKAEPQMAEDADIVVLSYGSPARSAAKAVKLARGEGIKAGFLRLVTVWPMYKEALRRSVGEAKVVLVAEMNMGQAFLEVERLLCSWVRVDLLPKPGPEPHTPSEILDGVRRSLC